nr:SPOR domain-containing protein [Thiorhodovibrio frisius]
MDKPEVPAVPDDSRLDQDDAPLSPPASEPEPMPQPTQVEPQEDAAMAQPKDEVTDARGADDSRMPQDLSAMTAAMASEDDAIDLAEAEELADVFDELDDQRDDAPRDQPIDNVPDLDQGHGQDQAMDHLGDPSSQDAPSPEALTAEETFAQALSAEEAPSAPPAAEDVVVSAPEEPEEDLFSSEPSPGSLTEEPPPVSLEGEPSPESATQAPLKTPTHPNWSGELKQLKRHMMMGLGAVTALALGLFGLGWWLFGAGAGATATTGAAASGQTPELVQQVEGRLAAIEGDFEAVDQRLSRLEQQAAALTEYFAGFNRGAPAISSGGNPAFPQAPAEPLSGTPELLANQPPLENAPPADLRSAPTAAEVTGTPDNQEAVQTDAQQAGAAETPVPSADTSGMDANASTPSEGSDMLSLTPASNSLVLNSVRYGIQLGAFGLEESARQLAREKSADGQSLYFFRSGPNGKMIAVIQGLYSTNQEVSDDLLEARRKYPKAWPRRFDPGAELTLFNPGAAQ